MDDDTMLTPGERAVLAEMRTDAEPPPGELDALVDRLAARGLLREGPRDHITARWWPLIAAAAALGGVLLGRATVRGVEVPPALPAYALLLLDSEGYSPALGADADSLVDAYRGWAALRSREGRLTLAEELDDGAAVVVASGGARREASSPVLGMFIIHADSSADAERLAATLPHVGRGGEVAVVPIIPH